MGIRGVIVSAVSAVQPTDFLKFSRSPFHSASPSSLNSSSSSPTDQHHQHHEREPMSVSETRQAEGQYASQTPLLQPAESGSGLHGYGATDAGNGGGGSSSSSRSSRVRRESPSALRRVPEEDPPVGSALGEEENFEEADEDLNSDGGEGYGGDADAELDLEGQGFYRGSYKRLMALYSLVPLASVLAYTLLAILPTLFWHSPLHHRPHPKYFPSPLPELITSIALWSLSHLLRIPIFTFSSFLFSFLPSPPSSSPSTSPSLQIILTTLLSTLLHVTFSSLLRLSSFPILRIKHYMDYPTPTFEDPAFTQVWWVAMGWAGAEVCVGVWQGWEMMGLYRDVLVSEEEIAKVQREGEGDVLGSVGGEGMGRRVREEGEGVKGRLFMGEGYEVTESPVALTMPSPHTHSLHSASPLTPHSHPDAEDAAASDDLNNSQAITATLHEDSYSPTAKKTLVVAGVGEGAGGEGSPMFGGSRVSADTIQDEVDRDIEMLIAMKAREELEGVYGMPYIKIPVFVSCLQRVDSMILSLGLTLVLSASYLRSPISNTLPNTPNRLPPSPFSISSYAFTLITDILYTFSSFFSSPTPPLSQNSIAPSPLKPSILPLPSTPNRTNTPFFVALGLVVVIHWSLTLLYTSPVLPRIGVHSAAYVGLVVSLGCWFAGLGMWGALS
ncbi:hypothetical protein JAAARDRAFT_79508 [Jaapia argillacea MUCL 33604]|uniref:Uncharacterized protein n=1 Tax=Jaapia argillacea MUCL 33604 TaxID=933084 RepID=A0A067PME7_9AGAM|nr:hypothetical protein JAAARDRAFT_79508 [Jaapia argillacea MUCL 33604]